MNRTMSKAIKKYAQEFEKKYGDHYTIRRTLRDKKSGLVLLREYFENHRPFENAQIVPLEIPEGIELAGGVKLTSRDLVKINHYQKLKEFYQKYGINNFIKEYMIWLKTNYLKLCDMIPFAVDKKGRIDPKRL